MPTDKPTQRIASLISAATEMLFALGLADRVVAVSHECDWPPEVATLSRVTSSRVDSAASSLEIDEQVQKQSVAGQPLYEIDREQLEALGPDVIVTQAQCDVCAVRYEDVVELVAASDRLSATNIVSLAPETLTDVLRDITRLGEALDVPQAAAQLVNQLETRLADVEHRVAEVPDAQRPRVAIIEWLEPLMIAGNWTPGLVERAGGRYELAVEGRHSPYAEWSALVEYDPQVLVLCPCGFDVERTLSEVARVTERREWRQLTAVKNGRVCVLDGNAYLNRSGPRLVDTVEILAHLVHPERCGVPASVTDPQQAWRPLANE